MDSPDKCIVHLPQNGILLYRKKGQSNININK